MPKTVTLPDYRPKPLADYAEMDEPAPWTEYEDRLLIHWGRAVSYGFVADHDLYRDRAEGEQRIAWLRENHSEYVKRVERSIDWEPRRQPWENRRGDHADQ